MASPTAMARCLRADATLMAVGDEAALARADRMAESLVRTTNEIMAGANLSPEFSAVILMLATARALEVFDG